MFPQNRKLMLSHLRRPTNQSRHGSEKSVVTEAPSQSPDAGIGSTACKDAASWHNNAAFLSAVSPVGKKRDLKTIRDFLISKALLFNHEMPSFYFVRR
ncbi:hypothetical protein AVEN_226168-1 [Araneus ventricosus]|uniref:Uncharacterized protein n=1 Tax=Araneus ventricosus TaxID=182803 RepID=A0A4Y2UGM7_ARAVE|nr:hypothetical protein AVEN_226168-1 [Araneus ventricosus]